MKSKLKRINLSIDRNKNSNKQSFKKFSFFQPSSIPFKQKNKMNNNIILDKMYNNNIVLDKITKDSLIKYISKKKQRQELNEAKTLVIEIDD